MHTLFPELQCGEIRILESREDSIDVTENPEEEDPEEEDPEAEDPEEQDAHDQVRIVDADEDPQEADMYQLQLEGNIWPQGL